MELSLTVERPVGGLRGPGERERERERERAALRMYLLLHALNSEYYANDAECTFSCARGH